MAAWRASKYGLTGDLLHPSTAKRRPAEEIVQALMDHVRPALALANDDATARSLMKELISHGTGAQQQREVFDRTGSLTDVVATAISVTTELDLQSGRPADTATG
jgi:carboxylate-amine ligase